MSANPASKNQSDSRQRRFTRSGEIARLMGRLNKDSYPRLQMSLLVALTGGAGLLASFLLLHSGGVEAMHVRYPVAVGCAYLVFLFLLWLWLRTEADDYLDGSIDIPDLSGSGSHGVDARPDFGTGGSEFGGGGASGNFVMDDSLPSTSLPIGNGDGIGAMGEAVGEVVGSADEGAIPLAVALLIAALVAVLLFATFYIVYLAPALFAELLVDGVLSASLYRRMCGLRTRHWLESALRRTALPFTATAAGLSLIGYALHAYAPEAHTLGEVLQHVRMD